MMHVLIFINRSPALQAHGAHHESGGSGALEATAREGAPPDTDLGPCLMGNKCPQRDPKTRGTLGHCRIPDRLVRAAANSDKEDSNDDIHGYHDTVL